jgi:hypothetical protein
MTGRLRITWAPGFAGSLVGASPSGDIETGVFITFSCTASALKSQENVIGKQADSGARSEQGIRPLL